MKIIADNKEKTPWSFEFFDTCEAQIESHLDFGDYTVEGFEDIVRVERKASTGEIATNIGKHRERFRREFEKLSAVQYPFLVCEFGMYHINNYPILSGVPYYTRKRLKISNKFLKKSIFEICSEFGVTLRLCGNREDACQLTMEIFNAVVQGDDPRKVGADP